MALEIGQKPLGFRLFCKALLLLLFAATCSGAWAGSERMTRPSLDAVLRKLGYISLPMLRSESNSPYLVVGFGGKPRKFLLDTGCSLSRLDPLLGKKLKPVTETGITLKDSIREDFISPETVLLEELDFGPFKLANEPAELGTVNGSGEKVFDGILGGEFLRRHHCIVDCTDPRLYFRGTAPDAAISQALEQLLQKSQYIGAPLSNHWTVVMVNCRINDHPATLLVDTGASFTGISLDRASALDLTLLPTADRVAGLGAIGSVKLFAAKPKSLTFAGREMPLFQLHFSVADFSNWSRGNRSRLLEKIDGMLGSELLAANGALLDYATLTLWYQPGASKK